MGYTPPPPAKQYLVPLWLIVTLFGLLLAALIVGVPIAYVLSH